MSETFKLYDRVGTVCFVDRYNMFKKEKEHYIGISDMQCPDIELYRWYYVTDIGAVSKMFHDIELFLEHGDFPPNCTKKDESLFKEYEISKVVFRKMDHRFVEITQNSNNKIYFDEKNVIIVKQMFADSLRFLKILKYPTGLIWLDDLD